MRYSKVLRVLPVLAVFVALQGQVRSGRAQNSSAGDTAKGKSVFTRAACAACHGDQGQGTNIGPRLASPDFDFAPMLNYVRRPGGVMPPVAVKTASDQDLADIYAFLRSIPAPNPTPPLTGDPQRGKKLFSSDGCYECHGTQGQGALTGARIGPPTISLVGFTWYVHRPGGQMPPYTEKVAPDQDLSDIYAFLKSIPLPPQSESIPLLNR